MRAPLTQKPVVRVPERPPPHRTPDDDDDCRGYPRHHDRFPEWHTLRDRVRVLDRSVGEGELALEAASVRQPGYEAEKNDGRDPV